MGHFFAYLFIRLLLRIVSMLPFSLLYPLSSGLCSLLQSIVRYRKEVIEANLKRIFPHKSEGERQTIKDAFYRQFADLLVESIKGLYLSERSLRKRYHYENPAFLDEMTRNHGGVILLGGHYANWEWGVLSFPLVVSTPVLGVFKPLNNKFLDRWLQGRRQRFGLHLTSMAQVARHLAGAPAAPRIYVLIADQMPSDRKSAIWADLLGHPTPFLPGPEKLAGRMGYPVVHFYIQRTERGLYTVHFELLNEEPRDLPPGALTQLYANAIGRTIEQTPENWLWSHRRWKW